MEKPIYTIDGSRFTDFPGFVEEFNRIFVSTFGAHWNGNLDAFNDYLSWAESDYILQWNHADISRQALGHAAMAQWLTLNLAVCHPMNVASVSEKLQRAEQAEGPTLFDWLIEIMNDNKDQLELHLA